MPSLGFVAAFEVGTAICKDFGAELGGIYDGIVKSFDSKTGYYKVEYSDGDCEDLEEAEVKELVALLKQQNKKIKDDEDMVEEKKEGDLSPSPNKKRSRKVSPPSSVSSVSSSSSAAAPKERTSVSRSGRTRKQRFSYNTDDYFDDLDMMADSEEEDEDADVVAMEEDEKPSPADIKTKNKRKRSSSSGKKKLAGTTKKKKTLSGKKAAGKSKRKKALDSDSEASFDSAPSSDGEDLLEFDSSDEDEEPEEEEEVKPKAKKGANGKRGSATSAAPATTSGGKPKVKMHEAFQPMNAPSYPNQSLEEIQRTKDYLDPGGMEATDDIIGSLVGDQVLKIGGLFTRALKAKNDNKSTKGCLGSAQNPLTLGTACSGTDAPALALTLIQEQMEQRLYPTMMKNKKGGDDAMSTDDDNNECPKFCFSHKFSCEVDPFKQAYLARNFDSVLYPDIAKLCDDEPRDVYGQVHPLDEVSMFIAGTSCKNFSMLRSNRRLDIEDRGCSGETFLAAVEVILKQQPKFCILENVKGAPWAKMSEYLTGRVKLDQCHSNKAIKNIPPKDKNKDLTFVLDKQKIVVEQVPAVYGVRCGATVAGFLKGDDETLHAVEWPSKKGKTATCTLKELIQHNGMSRNDDTLVFETPGDCTYCAHWVDVDTKRFGLPQTRQRTYMLVWKSETTTDDLGIYWEQVVRFLESPVRHSLEAFLLQCDHDIIRVFREALIGPPGRQTKRGTFLEPYFWTSASANLPHNKTARERLGIEDEARFVTNWGPYGHKQVPPHYWLEYLNCNFQREQDMLDILHASAARDAESHDSSFASYFWNISQNVSKEKHKSATPGIAGCITPGGDFLLPHQGRPLLGCEKLLAQGIPYFRLALGNETEVQLGDLAGNAMSLTVVCATMLAAVVAPQLRSEMQEGKKKHFEATKDEIQEYLRQRAGVNGDSQADNDSGDRPWQGEIPFSSSDASISERSKDDATCLSFLREIAKLAPLAVKSSIWCTCETSGSNSDTNKFLQCQLCRVACCRNCICSTAGYNLDSHDTKDVEIVSDPATGDVRSIGSFQAKLRHILPPTLYFTQAGIDDIASIDGDTSRIRGLDKFTFALHRIKRDRGKWLIVYYARDNNGLGEAVAEFRIAVGELKREHLSEDNTLGVTGELTSFMPARTSPLVYGKLKPCCKVTIPFQEHANALGNVTWQVRQSPKSASLKIQGEGVTSSNRIDVGLTNAAAKALREHSKKKNVAKAFGGAKSRGEQRRWLYADNWEEWPETIVVSSADKKICIDDRIAGTYKRARCRQTTNQSALWIKQSDEEQSSDPFVYIIIKPNVNRTGADQAIISTSIDHDDSSCILAEFSQMWQPCDALVEKYHNQNVTTISWSPSEKMACLVPKSKIRVESPARQDETLVVVKGLKETDVSMLCRGMIAPAAASNGSQTDNVKLNVFSGQQAQQIVRVINSTVIAPILKHAAMGKLKYDLSPSAQWNMLKPSSIQFGCCKQTIPPRPTEQWNYDTERESWERSSEPGASRKYYLQLQEAPKAFEFWLSRESGTLQVKCFPEVVAHHAAGQLLAGRGDCDAKDVDLTIRLSDIAQQSDPKIERFRVQNCSAQEPTEVELKAPYQLYDRQQKVVTKMIAIEDGDTEFTELEMAEFAMPGSTGFSLMAKAQLPTKVKGGVIADAIGAGKTVISIAIILRGLERARKAAQAPRKSGATLVVVPPALIGQWKSEIDKFTSSLNVVQIYDFATLAKTKVRELIDADVVICPIDILESSGYLQNLVEKASLKHHKKNLPTLPQYTGQQEQTAARGIWIPHTSTDPYAGGNNPNNQKRRNQSAYYTYIYNKSVQEIRTKEFKVTDKGVPLEYFDWERIFVDEIHESLCTTKVELNSAKEKGKDSGAGFFKEKNRRAGRELLGITEKDISKRPLVCRRAVFGLTGTPLLDSSSRVIELANLMGGTYVIGLSSHWRKLERESCRDIFLHNYLEPKQSREIRTNIHEKCQDFLDVACCRNKAGEEMEGIELVEHRRVARMTEGEKKLYLKSQKGIQPSKQSLSIQPEDFDASAGHDISCFLRQNAKFECRGSALLDICNSILKHNPTDKIIVFTDGRIGGGEAARDFLQQDGGPGCTWLDQNDSVQEKNRKISYYQTGDATEEDRRRPRVLVLHFEHAAGLNLQTECHNLILFTPLYVGDGGSSSDPVTDASTELQAIGRVFRAGQPSPKVNVFRIEVKGPDGEECLDGQLIRRNTDQETVAMATNAGED